MWSILWISLAISFQATDVQAYRGKAWIQWAAEAQSPDREVRLKAIGFLDAFGAQSVPLLTELLLEEDSSVRGTASSTLIGVGTSAVPALVELLKSDTQQTRSVASWTLIRMGPTARTAIPALVKQLREGIHPEAAARTFGGIARSIDRLGPYAEEAVEVLCSYLEAESYQGEVAYALGGIGPEASGAVPGLCELLTSDSHTVRENALEALALIGPGAVDAIPTLMELCRNSKWDSTKAKAVYALGNIGLPAVPFLVELLEDPDYKLRRSVIMALARMGPRAKSVIPCLLTQLESLSVTDRIEVPKAIHRIDPTDQRAAIRLSHDEIPWVRMQVAEELGNLGPMVENASAVLIQMLQDENDDVQSTAVRALIWFGPRARDAVPTLRTVLREGKSEWVRRQAALTLTAISDDAKEVVGIWMPFLAHEDSWDRRLALLILSELLPWAEPAIPRFEELLLDSDNEVRYVAACLLSKFGRRGESALLELLHHEDPGFRGNVAFVLACGPHRKTSTHVLLDLPGDDERLYRELSSAIRYSDELPDGIPPLAQMSQKPQMKDVVLAVLEELESNAVDTVPELRKLLQAEDWEVRREAIKALGRIGPAAANAVPELRVVLRGRVAHTPTYYLGCIGEAAHALGMIGPKAESAVPELRELLTDLSWQTRSRAAEALGRIGPAAGQAIPDIRDLLWDSSRSEAARALGRIGPDALQAAPALRRLMQVNDAQTQAAAAFSLSRIDPESDETVRLLKEMLGHRNRKVRIEAASSLWLCQRESEAAVHVLKQLLLEALEIPEERFTWQMNFRAVVAEQLGRMGERAAPAIPVLKMALNQSNNPESRLAALSALIDIATSFEEILPLVHQCLDDPSPEVRIKAISAWAEGEQEKKEAIEAMERLLVFPSAEVRAKAAEALDRLRVSDDHRA
jgi:HEAT repeat protein